MKDLAYDIVENASNINYDSLPKEVVQVTKNFILDTIGNIIAGSSAPVCNKLIRFIKDFGGNRESTVIAYDTRVPSPDAAFINSTMSFIRGLSDTQDESTTHAYVTVLPVALAMAERKGNVSGKEFIVANAVGVDLVCRLSLGAVGNPVEWSMTAITGCFGATIAAGKILGLDKNKLHHAMGIVYSHCAGNWQPIVDRGLVTRLQPGFAAKAAIFSTLLAQEGITGAKDIFEGRHGFFSLYFDSKYDRKRILEGLGKVFEGNNLAIKLFPCCRFTTGSIEAALNIVQTGKIRPEEVAEVNVHVTPEGYGRVGRPFEIGESPEVDAQFSIPYTVAVAITKGDVFIDDFSTEKIKTNTQVLNLAKKVKVIADQAPMFPGLTPSVVNIKTRDGKVYSQLVEFLKGDIRNPLTKEEIEKKFKKCTAFSLKPIPTGKIDKIINAVNNLEDVENVSEIVTLLS